MDYGKRKCVFCEKDLDTKGSSSIMLVTAWIKANGKTVYKQERHEYKFAHTFCLDIRDRNPADQLELF